jgi:hypothetical protein
MVIHRLETLPAGFSEYDSEEIDVFNFMDLIEMGIDEIWYWYGGGCYEGVGQILMRRGQWWVLHNAAHCSCYGPTDDIPKTLAAHPSLNSLQGMLSDEYLKEVLPLIDMARAAGY